MMQKVFHGDDAKMQIVLTAVLLCAVLGFFIGYGNRTKDKVYSAEVMQAVLTVGNSVTFTTDDGKLFTAKANKAVEVGSYYAVVLKDTKCTDEIDDDVVVNYTLVTETMQTVRRGSAVEVNRISTGRK